MKLKTIYELPKNIVPILIFLNFCITVYIAAFIDIRIDEAYCLNTTGKDIVYAINQSLHLEAQAPLYFIILSLWRSLNKSIFFARLFSIFCTSLSLYTISLVSKRFLNKIHPGWVVAFVAFNPFIIWAALEIRSYAFIILLSSLILLYFFDGYLTENSKTQARNIYILLSIFSLYTQYYMGFILVANAFALLGLKKWQALRNYCFGMVFVGFCFIPMLLILPSQLQAYTKYGISSISFKDVFKLTIERVLYYTFPARWVPLVVRAILKIIFLIVGLFLFLKNRKLITSSNVAIWITTSVIGLFVVAILKSSDPELVLPRHTAVLFFPLIISVFSVFKNSDQIKTILILTLVALFLNVGSLYNNYKSMTKDGDYAKVASYIMNFEKPGQAILVFNAEYALPFSYYYSGVNKVLPLPKAQKFKDYNLYDFVLNNEQEISNALSTTPGKHEYIWLVKNDLCKFLNVDYNCQILDKFVKNFYDIKAIQIFPKVRIMLLHQKAG